MFSGDPLGRVRDLLKGTSREQRPSEADARAYGRNVGMPYADFNATACEMLHVERYLEVGVFKGEHLARIPCRTAFGVDPHFRLEANVAANKEQTFLYQTTSDDFFASADIRAKVGGPFDYVFLDGMHHFEHLLRDFYNAEAFCSAASVIVLHDCVPTNFEMTERTFDEAGRTDKVTAKWWTGDVWKVVPILRKHRPDLRIMTVDCPPTGLICITGLDPASTVLRQNVDAIVAAASIDGIEAFTSYLDAIEMTASGDALRVLAAALAAAR